MRELFQTRAWSQICAFLLMPVCIFFFLKQKPAAVFDRLVFNSSRLRLLIICTNMWYWVASFWLLPSSVHNSFLLAVLLWFLQLTLISTSGSWRITRIADVNILNPRITLDIQYSGCASAGSWLYRTVLNKTFRIFSQPVFEKLC